MYTVPQKCLGTRGQLLLERVLGLLPNGILPVICVGWSFLRLWSSLIRPLLVLIAHWSALVLFYGCSYRRLVAEALIGVFVEDWHSTVRSRCHFFTGCVVFECA